MREPADSEVGQVRQLLLVLELHEVEADYGSGRPVEERREGGDEEDHQSSELPDDGEGHGRGYDRGLARGCGSEGEGGGDRTGAARGQKSDGRAGELRLH